LPDRTFRLLVFDWDGTLMDSIATIVDCTLAAFTGIDGVEPPARERIRESIGMGLVETMQHHFPHWEEGTSARLVENYRRLWRADFKNRVALFPDSFATIERLHADGYLLGVATAKGRVGLERELDATGLRPFFHATRTVDEAPSKPAPGMLLGLCDELGVRPAETLMVGVLTGAQGAAHFAACEPLAVLSGVAELPAWLAGDPALRLTAQRR
jgi:phosphoglycolate phosphatase